MGTDKISTRELQRLGPVREKQSLDDALKELADLGRARMVAEGRKKLIQIRPEVLGGAE